MPILAHFSDQNARATTIVGKEQLRLRNNGIELGGRFLRLMIALRNHAGNTEKYQAFAGKPFPIEQLKEETFISREKGSGTYQAGKELLNELGIDIAQLRTAVEIRSTESVKQMVSEGLGVGLIAQSAAQDYVQFGKLLAFPFPDSRFRRQLYIVKHKNSILSPIAQVFYDYARKAKEKASAQ